MDKSHVHVEQKKPFTSIYVKVKDRTVNPWGQRSKRLVIFDRGGNKGS